jgi:hypothetical protein
MVSRNSLTQAAASVFGSILLDSKTVPLLRHRRFCSGILTETGRPGGRGR